MGRIGRWRVVAAAAALALASGPAPALGSLETTGFRAVGVAWSAYPISALAVAPDGRLFVAVQALGAVPAPGATTAEIRVYSAYASNDGSVLDEGSVWATLDNVRATSFEEGLLGLALAPDFPTSKLVYVYVTTTDESANQHVRVFRENAQGTGDYLGTVMTTLEPPSEGNTRNGGTLAFGADGCLYVGVGDNGSSGNSRWHAQVLVGTNTPVDANENIALCNSVCLGTTEYPDRVMSNGASNHAGKVLRLGVEGASVAQGGQGEPFALQPFAWDAGLRNPLGLASHPLSGQLFAADRTDAGTVLRLLETGANHGWPCLDGNAASNIGCLAGHTADEVRANHPTWRRPLVEHPAFIPGGAVVYTGPAYPAEFFGDLFYLPTRVSARIYRLDLQPPCFLPDPAGVLPTEFHDGSDGDFDAFKDLDGDGDFETVRATTLTSFAQGPDPLGRQVLYVGGNTGSSSNINEDGVVYRIEYGLDFTPWAGSTGRVPDSCFAGGPYENAFRRPTCLPPGGPCPGAPDGTACGDPDPCNGDESCSSGICRHGAAAADDTLCTASDQCHDSWTCQGGFCTAGPVSADGTPCSDGELCNGIERCQAGVCQPGEGPQVLTVQKLTLKRDTRGPGTGSLLLSGSVSPRLPLAPDTTDPLALELRDGADMMFSAYLDHPASDSFWRRPKRNQLRYGNRAASGGLNMVLLKTQRSGAVQLELRGKRLSFTGLDASGVQSRLVIGPQCFLADLAGRCSLDAKKLRCR